MSELPPGHSPGLEMFLEVPSAKGVQDIKYNVGDGSWDGQRRGRAGTFNSAIMVQRATFQAISKEFIHVTYYGISMWTPIK